MPVIGATRECEDCGCTLDFDEEFDCEECNASPLCPTCYENSHGIENGCEDDLSDESDDDRSMFADPGGRSALRAAGPDNPRNLPCPTCGAENRLTPADRAQGYQCDACADRDEGSGF